MATPSPDQHVHFHFIPHSLGCGATYDSADILESTGVCGVRQNQAGGSFAQERPEVPMKSISAKEEQL